MFSSYRGSLSYFVYVLGNDDEIEIRYNEYALSPKADCGRPLNLAPVNERTAEPEGVAFSGYSTVSRCQHPLSAGRAEVLRSPDY